MKKVVLGAFMMLAGVLGAAILLAGTMANSTMMINGGWSFSWNLSSYGLIPALVIFTICAFVGLVLGIWGLFDKKN